MKIIVSLEDGTVVEILKGSDEDDESADFCPKALADGKSFAWGCFVDSMQVIIKRAVKLEEAFAAVEARVAKERS